MDGPLWFIRILGHGYGCGYRHTEIIIVWITVLLGLGHGA